MKKSSSMLGNSMSPSVATLGVLGLAFMVTALNANVTSLRGKVAEAPSDAGGQAVMNGAPDIAPMQRFDTQVMLNATKNSMSFGKSDEGFVSATPDWYTMPSGFDTKSMTRMLQEGRVEQPGMVGVSTTMPQNTGGNGMSAGMQAPSIQNTDMDSSMMHGAAGGAASVSAGQPTGDNRSADHQGGTPTASMPSMGTNASTGHEHPVASAPSDTGGGNSSDHAMYASSIPSANTGNNSSGHGAPASSVPSTGAGGSSAHRMQGGSSSMWSDQGQFNASTGRMDMGQMPTISSDMQMPHAAAATPGAIFADVVGEIFSMPGVLLSVPAMIMSIAF